MIAEIVTRINDSLSLFPFLDRVGGVVTPLVKTTAKGKSIMVPVEFSRDEPGKVIDFVPDSTEVGLAYWELEGERPGGAAASAGRRGSSTLQAELILALWVNLERIDPPDLNTVQQTILAALPSQLESVVGGFAAARLSFVGRASVKATFGRYAYDKADSRMFHYPYAGMGLRFSVTYVPVVCERTIQKVDAGCLDSSSEQPPQGGGGGSSGGGSSGGGPPGSVSYAVTPLLNPQWEAVTYDDESGVYDGIPGAAWRPKGVFSTKLPENKNGYIRLKYLTRHIRFGLKSIQTLDDSALNTWSYEVEAGRFPDTIRVRRFGEELQNSLPYTEWGYFTIKRESGFVSILYEAADEPEREIYEFANPYFGELYPIFQLRGPGSRLSDYKLYIQQ